MSPSGSSPIPKTRVEKVDNEPSHGEVPGTEAHKLRQGDAIPDEVAIIPDEAPSDGSLTPSGVVPATVVEESSGDGPGPHSDDFNRKRSADASPDMVLTAEGDIKELGGEDITGTGVGKS